MRINNEIYQAYGHGWWSEDAPFEVTSLRYCMNPVRYGYFKRKLEQLPLPDKTVLDVGCGGGFLADNNLEIDYRVGKGEALPFPDGSFDIVACCDVLEHVDDLGRVINEAARTLKAGGVFCYDTVNRTWWSKIALIKVSQEWAFTRWAQPDTHVWEKFIKPAELIAVMNRFGLANRELTGIASGKNPLALLASLRILRKKRLSDRETAATLALCESKDLRISYMGYAIKNSSV